MGPRGVALASLPTTWGRPLIWLHRQKGLQERPKNGTHLQHARLHLRTQPPELHSLPGDCQNLAQRSSKEGRNVHLADPQPGPSGRHLASTHGYLPTMQSLRLRTRRIAQALLARVPHGAACLGSLQENLERMEGAW